MKRTALFGLIAAATLSASPVFAAEDLCAINLQKLSDSKAMNAPVGQPTSGDISSDVDAAKAAQAKGDTEGCIAATSRALAKVQNSVEPAKK